MPNRLVVFPVGKETEALAYQAFANRLFPDAPDLYAYIRNDAFGQWVVPYAGPPATYSGGLWEEPTSETPADDGPTMRADGVLADSVTWPDDE